MKNRSQYVLPDIWSEVAVKQERGDLMSYDSSNDTRDHIYKVQELIKDFTLILLTRAKFHDKSKLESPEKPLFDETTPKLKGSTYGATEYFRFLEQLKPALDHHYANNSHHPEAHKDGISGMTLVDLVEMFFDWKAASQRHENGDFKKSIQINTKRFCMSDQLAQIFENTRIELGL